ncbi:hypothetical protein TNCV_163411 [Trichonephila clavipes]|nr:hypothetical protein TNCV_163411 [Trichonephila clavipes]
MLIYSSRLTREKSSILHPPVSDETCFMDLLCGTREAVPEHSSSGATSRIRDCLLPNEYSVSRLRSPPPPR